MTLVAMLETDHGPVFLADMLASGLEEQGEHPLRTPVSFLRTGDGLSWPFSGVAKRKIAIPRKNLFIGFAGSFAFGHKVLDYFENAADLTARPSLEEITPHAEWLWEAVENNSYILSHYDPETGGITTWCGPNLPIGYGKLEGVAIGMGAEDIGRYLDRNYDNRVRRNLPPYSGLDIICNCATDFIAGERLVKNGLADDQRYGGGYEIVVFDGEDFIPYENIAFLVGILRISDGKIRWTRGLTSLVYYEGGFPVAVSTSGPTNLVYSVPDALERRASFDERLVCPSIILSKFTRDEYLDVGSSSGVTETSYVGYRQGDFSPRDFELSIDAKLDVTRRISLELGERIVRDAANRLGFDPCMPIDIS